MEKTFIPCTRGLQVLDSQSGQVSPFYDYKVLREAVAGLGESISVRIEEENGTEKVYVAGVFEPVASMLPNQSEDDEMLLGLFQGWAPPPVTWNLKVEKKANHYVLASNRCPVQLFVTPRV